MCWPSGENSTELILAVCPVKGPPIISPVAASHTQIVLSCEPEAMCWPSGENATDQTISVCLVQGPTAISPVVAFHTQIIPFSEPDAMCRPSGETAVELTWPPDVEITNSDAGQ